MVECNAAVRMAFHKAIPVAQWLERIGYHHEQVPDTAVREWFAEEGVTIQV